jgi:hypothetical protein
MIDINSTSISSSFPRPFNVRAEPIANELNSLLSSAGLPSTFRVTNENLLSVSPDLLRDLAILPDRLSPQEKKQAKALLGEAMKLDLFPAEDRESMRGIVDTLQNHLRKELVSHVVSSNFDENTRLRFMNAIVLNKKIAGRSTMTERDELAANEYKRLDAAIGQLKSVDNFGSLLTGTMAFSDERGIELLEKLILGIRYLPSMYQSSALNVCLDETHQFPVKYLSRQLTALISMIHYVEFADRSSYFSICLAHVPHFPIQDQAQGLIAMVGEMHFLSFEERPVAFAECLAQIDHLPLTDQAQATNALSEMINRLDHDAQDTAREQIQNKLRELDKLGVLK